MPSDSPEQNKAIIRQIVAALNNGRMISYGQLYDAKCVLHGFGRKEIKGLETLTQFNQLIHEAFPDIQYIVEEIIAEGDLVAWRYIAKGTHDGKSMGIFPTGKSIALNGMVIDRFANGKVAEHWLIFDGLDMFRQVGLLPFVKEI